MRDGMVRGAAFVAVLALTTGAPNSGMLAGRFPGLRQRAMARASRKRVLQARQPDTKALGWADHRLCCQHTGISLPLKLAPVPDICANAMSCQGRIQRD